MTLLAKSLVMGPNIEIIDNFLTSYQLKSLQTILMGDRFPWYYKSYIAYNDKEDKDYQFCHHFLGADEPSNLFLIEPFQKLGRMIRVKANMRPRTLFHRRSYYHTDNVSGATKTSIFYLNTCNGYTKFKKSGVKVKTVANRLVTFDPKLEHAAFSQTDEKVRVVINFNYEH